MYVPLIEELAEPTESIATEAPSPSRKKTLQVIYRLREDARVRIKLVNSNGKIRREFDMGRVKEGVHTSSVDVSRIPAGVYSLQILRGKLSRPAQQTVILY